MSEKTPLTPTQELYKKIFGELPKRDMVESDMPTLYEVFETLTERELRIINTRFGFGQEKMSRAALGRELDMSPRMIERFEGKVIRSLRHESCASKVKPLFFTYEEMRAEINKRDGRICELLDLLHRVTKENAELRKESRELKLKPVEPLAVADVRLSELLDLELHEVGISDELHLRLRMGGMKTLRDVVMRHTNGGGLLKVRNIGVRSVETIEAKLAELGVPLDRPKEYYL